METGNLVLRPRNPWRFSFDRVTGDLNIGDVGQDTYEEIDYQPVGVGSGRGVNFGWSCLRGPTPVHDVNPPPPVMVEPVFEYTHVGRGACSITGGYVVQDQEVPSLLGRYLYSDYCNGAIYSNILHIPDAQGDAPTGLDAGNTTSFGEDSCGHVYVAGQSGSPNVWRIRENPPGPQSCIPRYDLPVLTAHVEDDFTIELNDPNGQNLDGGTLPEGAYTLELDDNSIDHNFHLTGGSVSCVPRQSCASDVETTGTRPGP